jgi:hypothetical protein
VARRSNKTDVSRYWPRLREEAHELYREVGVLQGQIRQLERELAGSRSEADRLRGHNETLSATLEQTRARLRRIEGSKAWRLAIKMRGAVRGHTRGEVADEPLPADERTSAPVVPSGREPTFAQRRAAEAARRAEVAVGLSQWIDAARGARGSVVIVIAGDPTHDRTTSFIEAAQRANDPVLLLDAEPAEGRGGLPARIMPSLVPDLLAMDIGNKDRLFLSTTPGHGGIRWTVPAQQRGWWTAAVLDMPVSPAGIYLATHADVIVVPDDDAARAVEAAAGVRPLVNASPAPRDLLQAARTGWDALPRAVLGSD